MIIALCGKKGVGKDTLANALCESFDIYRLAFGDYIKRLAVDIYPEELYIDYPHELKEKKILFNNTKSPRDVWTGLNIVSELCPNYFVDKLERECNKLKEIHGVNNIIITDVRKKAEYDWCKKNNIPIIKIESDKSREGIKEDSIECDIDSFLCDHTFINYFNESSIDSFVYFAINDVIGRV